MGRPPRGTPDPDTRSAAAHTALGRPVEGVLRGAFPWEFEQMGIPAAPVAERVRLLDEALRVVPPLLNGEKVTFRGEQITVAGATLTPPPRTDPRVPILVGGAGERVTLRQETVRLLADAVVPRVAASAPPATAE